MNPYEFEEACEAYRKAWLHEVAIYVALMLISGTIGYFFGAASCL
jgi:hypothetical protein